MSKPPTFATMTAADYRRLVVSEMPEAELLLEVETSLTRGRWRWTHVGRSDLAQMHGDPGVPDILAVRGDVLLVRELKASKGRMETGQAEWLEALGRVRRVDAGVWHPDDINEIRRIWLP